MTRGVPVKRIALADGRTVTVATVYDLLMAQYGVNARTVGRLSRPVTTTRRSPTPRPGRSSTPASGGRRSSASRASGHAPPSTPVASAPSSSAPASTTGTTRNLMYRAGIHALMFCGCVGVNGGGLAHYVGQEKLAPGEPW